MPLPTFLLKTLKKIYLKSDLSHWYNFFIIFAVTFGDISFNCIPFYSKKTQLHYVDRPRDTKGFRTSLTLGVKHCRLLEKFFPKKFPRNHKSVEQDQSRSRMNQFPGLPLLSLQFLRQNIFCFQLVGNINWYRSGKLENIGIEKSWTCTHQRNGNEPNAGNKKLFRIK